MDVDDGYEVGEDEVEDGSEDVGDEEAGTEREAHEEEHDLRQFGIYQALPVDGEPDWSSEVLDAEEYLRRVRHEAARCPRVVRADVNLEALQQQHREKQQHGDQQQQQPRQKPRRHHLSAAAGHLLGGDGRGSIAAAPDWAVPSRQWVLQFVGDFQTLRRQVSEVYETGELAADCVLPGARDLQAWDRLCFGGGDEHAGQSAAAGGEAVQAAAAAAAAAPAAAADGGGSHSDVSEGDGGTPRLGPSDGGGGGGDNGAVPGSEITYLSPFILPTLMALDQVGVRSLFMHHAQQLQERRPASLPLVRAQWLFALAARLEKPIHAEVAAALRGVLRHCAALRAALGDRGDPLLARLNVIIAVAGAYFGQDEGLVQLVDSVDLI